MTGDDYVPVVDEGELEEGSGLVARLRRRESLTPVGTGFTRVLLDENGRPISKSGQPTAGEKRNKQARRWARVDTSHHHLEHSLRFKDPSGRIGFVAEVTTDVSVRDAAELIEYGGATSVKGLVDGVLGRALTDSAKPKSTETEMSVIDGLAATRESVAEAVRAMEGRALAGVPGWLSATVQSVRVDFDSPTQEHYDRLVTVEQKGQVSVAEQVNKETEVEGKIKVRNLWRKDLMPHLRDSSTRMFEDVFDNPTDENIRAAVRQANERELLVLHEVLDSFTALADKGLVDKGDPAVVAMTGMVRRMPTILGVSEPALPSATEPEVLNPPGEPPEEEEPGDHDFND